MVFALDVSRSMLAEDVTPNRLDRAKQQISDMVDEMAGDRVGLVVFAGNAKQVLPLTSHYEDFKQILADVGPHSVTRGGSRLGDAIQVADDCFMNKTNEHKTIVLFTDGEDQLFFENAKTFSDILVVERGFGTVVGFGGDRAVLLGVEADLLGSEDFVFI